jgi:hypothetical protein
MPPAAETVFLPFPTARAAVPMASSFRSTWLTTSLRALRERGHYERYLTYLPAEYHEAVESSVAGVWLPVKVAVSHYEACGKLDLSIQEQLDIGAEVTKRIHGTVLGTLVRLATGAGATPWTVYSNLHRLWDRIWVGGGVGVFQLGPKEARIEVIAWPCSRVSYCRVAMRGVIHGVTDLFCQKAYVHEIPKLCTPTTLGFKVQWA